jgi:hypothetical protein
MHLKISHRISKVNIDYLSATSLYHQYIGDTSLVGDLNEGFKVPPPSMGILPCGARGLALSFPPHDIYIIRCYDFQVLGF